MARRHTQHQAGLAPRGAVEPVIGHLKEDHGMDRNHLAGRIGNAANAVPAAVGYNVRRYLLRLWLSALGIVRAAANQSLGIQQTV